MVNRRIGAIAAFLVTIAASAQQGIGTDTPEKSSVLELQSTKRGLLIPRVALTATNVKKPVNDPANSLLVYNTNTTTASAGANAVTPGYYYWSAADTAWIRIMNQKDVDTAIANIADTKVTSATLSGTTLTIKQNGVTPDVTVNLAALDTNTTYTGSTSVTLNGTSFERAALTGDVTAAANNNNVTVTKIQGKAIDASAPSTGQVLKWDGSKWAPAADDNTNTQSKETVEGTGIIKVTGSGSTGDNNRNFTVSIESAGPSGTKVLQSVNGTVKWADAPSTGGNLQAMKAKVKTTTSGPLPGTAWGANAEDSNGVYLVVLKYGFVGVVNLPNPADFENRSIALQNISGSSRSFGSNPPANIGSIGSNRAMQLVSDGTSWYVAGGL